MASKAPPIKNTKPFPGNFTFLDFASKFFKRYEITGIFIFREINEANTLNKKIKKITIVTIPNSKNSKDKIIKVPIIMWKNCLPTSDIFILVF